MNATKHFVEGDEVWNEEHSEGYRFTSSFSIGMALDPQIVEPLGEAKSVSGDHVPFWFWMLLRGFANAEKPN